MLMFPGQIDLVERKSESNSQRLRHQYPQNTQLVSKNELPLQHTLTQYEVKKQASVGALL